MTWFHKAFTSKVDEKFYSFSIIWLLEKRVFDCLALFFKIFTMSAKQSVLWKLLYEPCNCNWQENMGSWYINWLVEPWQTEHELTKLQSRWYDWTANKRERESALNLQLTNNTRNAQGIFFQQLFLICKITFDRTILL